MAVERGKEIVRQWSVLKRVASAADCTVPSLAGEHRVSTRTIYRDLAALQTAGFPLYDEERDGIKYWRLDKWPFGHLHDTGFTFPELCAFYIHRGRLAGRAGLPLEEDLSSAIQKVLASLSPKMKEYLDELSEVVCWKPEAPKPVAGKHPPIDPQVLVKATLEHRQIVMQYHSLSSRRLREYVVEPYRLTAGNGALYLYAYVPIYGQMRTFAVQRIRTLRVLEEQFDPTREVGQPHETSIGIGSGKPELVEIRFSPRLAPYIEERCWHDSQEITKQPDGSIVLSLRVAIDVPLRSWILGWGHMAHVLAPSTLASDILEELEEAREQYAPRIPFDLQPAVNDTSAERSLPLLPSRQDAVSPAPAPALRPPPPGPQGARRAGLKACSDR